MARREFEYTGHPERRPADAQPWSQSFDRSPPATYLPGRRLIHAVNVALRLRRPLLLTGEPGTGKTQLAFSLAWELGLAEPFIFETKSTSLARDLFYHYDAISHFRQSQVAAAQAQTAAAQGIDPPQIDTLDFIVWSALGEAILRSNSAMQIEKLLERKIEGPVEDTFVVLIDEIDKAPRDFPNDLLNEFERRFFRVPELRNREFRANPDHVPILILTSNSERNLPPAFLRRCIFCDIDFPRDAAALVPIVARHLPSLVTEMSAKPLLADALTFFFVLRERERQWEKSPGTAELLDWLTALQEFGGQPEKHLTEQRELHQQTMGAIVKSKKDQPRVDQLIADGSWKEIAR